MSDKATRLDTVDDEPDYGPSRLRRAYRPWKMMKIFEELELIAHERVGLDSRATEKEERNESKGG